MPPSSSANGGVMICRPCLRSGTSTRGAKPHPPEGGAQSSYARACCVRDRQVHNPPCSGWRGALRPMSGPGGQGDMRVRLRHCPSGEPRAASSPLAACLRRPRGCYSGCVRLPKGSSGFGTKRQKTVRPNRQDWQLFASYTHIACTRGARARSSTHAGARAGRGFMLMKAATTTAGTPGTPAWNPCTVPRLQSAGEAPCRNE